MKLYLTDISKRNYKKNSLTKNRDNIMDFIGIFDKVKPLINTILCCFTDVKIVLRKLKTLLSLQ